MILMKFNTLNIHIAVKKCISKQRKKEYIKLSKKGNKEAIEWLGH